MPTQNRTYRHTAPATPPAALYSLHPKPYTLKSFTFSAKERDVETGLSYFGSRYYSSDLSIWLSVDPQASKYPGLSPFTYCANNPVKLVDPNGEEVWIPGIDKQGNVTYTAEKGDNHDSFIKQFACNGKGKDIFKNAGYGISEKDIKKGDVIKGDAVKKATGSDVLKGNWNNMTKTQKAAQIMFALSYGEEHNMTVGDMYAINLNDFVNGFCTAGDGLSLNGVISLNEGEKEMVNMRIWPKSGLENTMGQIPIFYRGQVGGAYNNTYYYYSAKNPKARNPIPAISITSFLKKSSH